MELNETKKWLYKYKPKAQFVSASNISLTYMCFVKEVYQIYFYIPITDIGDAKFGQTMPAQQLIRWLVIPETENK